MTTSTVSTRAVFCRGRLIVTASVTIFALCSPVVSAQPVLLWDEATDGDLSNEMGSPTMLTIDRPGEYILRTSTGPLELLRREQPGVLGGLRLEALERLDSNSDQRIQPEEAAGNYELFFGTFDLNDDNELSFDEIAQFDMGGDVHDLFDFDQADGVNLVAIRVNEFDGGGEHNDVTVLAVMDLQSGRPREARGVVMTSKSKRAMAGFETGSPVIVGPAWVGEEIYEAHSVWKTYRRNDSSNHFRIGEMQAESTAELIFVFE